VAFPNCENEHAKEQAVISSILPPAVVSALVISTAWALPVSPTSQVHQPNATNFTQVGYYDKKYYNNKKYYKAEKKYYQKHYDKYYYGGRYYGHRYYARPPGWQTLGCFAAGPVWYCP
jgi:hypothetical protein